MVAWLTPGVAVVLMYLGVIPSLVNIYLLWDHRHKLGVVWFILSMATGGAWAFLFATFTLIPDPGITLALANFFWVMVATAAVSMFLLAYEFVFKQTVSQRVVTVAFAPIVGLFVLSWVNPANLVFTPEYGVTDAGFLQFSNFGGPVKFAITKLYGYLLVFLGAGMFVGEALRSQGLHRRQTVYLLLIFSMLVLSTMVKVAGLVPVYFDPTSVVYSLSGVLFAYSINDDGLMKFVPVAREQTFEAVNDVILILGPDEVVVDLNHAASTLFGAKAVGTHFETLLARHGVGDAGTHERVVGIQSDEKQRFFSLQTAAIAYGRGVEGKIVVLSDITELKRREKELELLKQIFTRFLRHNIRNDLNVIVGYAEFIRDDADGPEKQWSTGIVDKANKILSQAEKAREIEQVIGDEELKRCQLRTDVEQVVDSFTVANPVVFNCDVDDVTVEVHPKFDLAILELVDNAVTHHTGTSPAEVTISTELTSTTVTLVIEDSGPGIPSEELSVLDAEEETGLEHGSGIGLWLVHLIISRSNGELVAESAGDGTRIEIRLNRPA